MVGLCDIGESESDELVSGRWGGCFDLLESPEPELETYVNGDAGVPGVMDARKLDGLLAISRDISVRIPLTFLIRFR